MKPSQDVLALQKVRKSIYQAIDEAKDAGKEPLLVFDLDGTLYNNNYRTWRIFQEFAHTHWRRYPGLVEQLNTASQDSVTYLVKDSLEAIGVRDEACIKEITAFWFKRFFTNPYCLYDLPTPGAVEFVNDIYEYGGVPCYLTGRDAPNMLQGTLEALQRDGFPVGRVDTRMILKPNFEMEDLVFKEDVIFHLRLTGEVIASFDNEPGLCNLFKTAFPKADIVWLDTSHAPEPPKLRQDVAQAIDFTAFID